MVQTTLSKVSIIVPAYEHEEYALQAVQSALAQDYANLEVVFVDDASPIARFEAIRRIDDPRLRVFRNERNLGRAANYRHALYDLASGDWVLFLDGDDYHTGTTFVRKAVEAGDAEPGILIVAGRAVIESPHGRTVSPTPGEIVLDGMELLERLPERALLFKHMATLYRRTAALAVDFYRVPYISADWESLYRLAAGGRVAYIDEIVGVWRIHGVNASGTTNAEELGENLAVWKNIYAHAVSAGMPKSVADRCRRRCLRFIIRQTIPMFFRRTGFPGFLEYLRIAAVFDRIAVLQAIASPLGIGRIAAGLMGHYRRKFG